MPVLARNVVATSQPLAAQAGLRMLLHGGNAVDAAIATAIALTVVEPIMNGIGSDAFALVWDGTSLQGLNASGRAPRAWTPERFAGHDQHADRRLGQRHRARRGLGLGRACRRNSASFRSRRCSSRPSTMPRNGFLVSPIVASQWESQIAASEGSARLRAGFRAQRPRAARRRAVPVSRTGRTRWRKSRAPRGESFYRGALAQQHRRFQFRMRAASSISTIWPRISRTGSNRSARTIAVTALHEIPPNGQGIAALIALGILEHFDLGSAPVDSAESLHLQIEAMKLAFADVYRYVADSKLR